jgi:hypothetical protein
MRGKMRHCPPPPTHDFFEASKTKQVVCHTMALPFTLKKYLKAKIGIMKTQIFHHAKI